MNNKLSLICSVIVWSQSLIAYAAWCDANPEGLCIDRLNENDNKVRAWFDKNVHFESLLVGYDLQSEQGWSATLQQRAIYTEWDISSRADYTSGNNQSVWFSAYRARGASCWKRSERLYFHENWAGTNFIQRLRDRPDSPASEITYQDMIDRINPQGVMFDNHGQSVAFCVGDAEVSSSS